jgi:nicotinamidase-related amidase
MLKNAALLVCDLQVRAMKNLHNPYRLIKNTNMLIGASQNIPNIKTSIAAQLRPDILGSLTPELQLNDINVVYDKDTYSMAHDTLFEELDKHQVKDIILTGMEIQWCINQTVYDLTQKGFRVHIPTDAVGNSLSYTENRDNFNRLQQNGAFLCSSDGIICEQLSHFDEQSSKWYVRYKRGEQNNHPSVIYTQLNLPVPNIPNNK